MPQHGERGLELIRMEIDRGTRGGTQAAKRVSRQQLSRDVVSPTPASHGTHPWIL
jgi:hypothetical protein